MIAFGKMVKVVDHSIVSILLKKSSDEFKFKIRTVQTVTLTWEVRSNSKNAFINVAPKIIWFHTWNKCNRFLDLMQQFCSPKTHIHLCLLKYIALMVKDPFSFKDLVEFPFSSHAKCKLSRMLNKIEMSIFWTVKLHQNR